jgi:hypothetical protein
VKKPENSFEQRNSRDLFESRSKSYCLVATIVVENVVLTKFRTTFISYAENPLGKLKMKFV